VSNRGTISGVSSATWHQYEPLWLATNTSGNPTMPAIGNGTIWGRWLRTTGNTVVAQVGLTFGSTTTFGNGDAYIIGLPLPANRWTAGLSNTSNADLPIGTGFAWQGSAASPSYLVPLIPTLADPLAGYNLQTNEDYFAHLFTPISHIARGTASISGASTSTTVTHNLGLGSGGTASYSEADISLVNTASTGSPANPRVAYLSTLTENAFNINVQVAPGGATAFNFAWRLEARPQNTSWNLPQLVSYRRPWVFAQNHGIYCQFIYEARG
jgi:hypothetical protein